MTRYPTVFGFTDWAAGRGFLDGIAGNGRALLVHDDENGYGTYGAAGDAADHEAGFTGVVRPGGTTA